ncbi:hypothetical protein PsYK624_132060 [Phanerochaete sordida]|uniref:Uncharacterized protein n=1 Tax=Phanerochaete sordida TaxID=48140 RepID=A0A9P3GL49_9APHY|nr:hypothetical protein PsYK624_132060 [Phanerochaete sordida]
MASVSACHANFSSLRASSLSSSVRNSSTISSSFFIDDMAFSGHATRCSAAVLLSWCSVSSSGSFAASHSCFSCSLSFATRQRITACFPRAVHLASQRRKRVCERELLCPPYLPLVLEGPHGALEVRNALYKHRIIFLQQRIKGACCCAVAAGPLYEPLDRLQRSA